MAEATAPGQQGVLFVPDVERLTFTVVVGDDARHRSAVLGVVLSIARRVAIEKGEAWIVASDGSTVHLTPSGGESAFSRPWVRTVIDACKEQP